MWLNLDIAYATRRELGTSLLCSFATQGDPNRSSLRLYEMRIGLREIDIAKKFSVMKVSHIFLLERLPLIAECWYGDLGDAVPCFSCHAFEHGI